MIDLLVGARLVTSDENVVELAHEALARAWPRLRGWLEDDLEGQRILHHVAIAADSWDALGRPDSELYRGVRLAKALDWQDSSKPTLTETEQAFLAASKRLSEAELRAAEDTARHQLRVNRRLRTALGTAAFLLVGALIAGFVAVRQAERADQQATAAEEAAVAADAGKAGAKAVVQDDIDASMLLALAGVELVENSECWANLLAVLAKHPQLIRSVETEKLNVFGLDVSRDGQVVLNDQNGTALLYNPATGQLNGQHRPVNRPDGAVFGDTWGGGVIAFNPAGRHLAVGMPTPTTQPVRLLDPKTLEPAADSQQLPRFTNVPARATNVGHSRDGNSLFTVIEFYANGPWNDSTTGSLLVWDVRPGVRPKVRMTLPLAADAEAGRMELSPDGGRLYTSRPLAAYDVATGTMLYRQPELSSGDIDITADGNLLALNEEFPIDPGAADGGVRLIEAATGRTKRVLPGDGQELTRVLFSHDGTRLVSTSTDLTAKVWDVGAGLVAKEIRVGDQEIQGIGFSPDDTTLYTAKDGMLRSWDLTGQRGDIVQVKEPSGYALGCMIPGPGGRTVYRESATAVPWHHRIRFIDVATGKATQSRAMDPGQGTGGCGTWNPAGNRFATANKGMVTVWNTVTGEVVVKRRPASVGLMDLRYSGRDGSRIVIGVASGMATALDSETLEPVGRTVQVGAPINGISTGPDNRSALMLTGGRHISADLNAPATGWALVDLEAGKVLGKGKVAMRNPDAFTFSPDGRHVAIGSTQGEVLILDAVSGTAVGPPTKVQQGGSNLAYSADGSLLVSAGYDGSIGLLDGDTAALLGSVVIPSRTSTSAVFEPDGYTVLIASQDDGIYRWDTRLGQAIGRACREAGRDLTAEEWQQNFGERPYRKTCP